VGVGRADELMMREHAHGSPVFGCQRGGIHGVLQRRKGNGNGEEELGRL
jgi:hypothetical protein